MSKTRKKIDWKAYYQKYKEQYKKWGEAYRKRKRAEKQPVKDVTATKVKAATKRTAANAKKDK